MNLLKAKYTFLVLIMVIGLQSCSKFEDGPLISLRTKKQRLSRDWKIEYSVNTKTGIRHSADYDGWLLSFDKGGDFTKLVFYDNTETTFTGNWTLTDNQLKLEITTTSGSENDFYTITRLTKKEFWIKNKIEEIYYYSD